MRKACVTALLALALTAGASAATAPAWTKAGTVSALKAAPIWKGAAGAAGSYATMRVTAVSAAKPYGHTRKLAGKLAASAWDITATVSFGGASSVERFCVHPLGPLAGAKTKFQIGGWAWHSPTGGCAHYAASGQGAFEWGGSKTVPTHP